MGIKAFLFDCDGTLLDSNPLIIKAWKHTLDNLIPDAHITTEEILSYFGITFEGTVEIYKKKYNIPNVDMDHYHNIYWDFHNGHHELIEGAFPTVEEGLKALKAHGAKLGVVTSGMHDSCYGELHDCGIADYFDVIVGAEAGESKPSPVPALECCKKLGVDPKDAMMIGDSKADIECGNRAGCKTALVSWSSVNPSTLEGVEKPDIVIDDLSDLLSYMV